MSSKHHISAAGVGTGHSPESFPTLKLRETALQDVSVMAPM